MLWTNEMSWNLSFKAQGFKISFGGQLSLSKGEIQAHPNDLTYLARKKHKTFANDNLNGFFLEWNFLYFELTFTEIIS